MENNLAELVNINLKAWLRNPRGIGSEIFIVTLSVSKSRCNLGSTIEDRMSKGEHKV